MPTWLEQIEERAREKLTLPDGRAPAQELPRYRNFLKHEAQLAQERHRAGAGGREVCQARSMVLDTLFRCLMESVLASRSPAGRTPPTLALVAIGGYGRAELSPHSDVDVMFLHDGGSLASIASHPGLTLLSEGLLYDIGLKVGHSVRNLSDCVQVANTDMKSKTSLIEARLIYGNEELFQRFQLLLLEKCVKGFAEEYIAARLEDQNSRHSKYGDSAVMQEPNIKNGCGGLRDYQNLLWMTFFKYQTRTTEELEKHEWITSAEREQLELAYEFLLRTRNELHYISPRPQDNLQRNLQPSVALQLGYRDRSPRKRVEAFMRDYYTHARNIYLITRLVEQRLAILPPRRQFLPMLNRILRRKPAVEPVDGFKFVEGKVEPVSNRVFDDSPRRLLRVFLYAQQRGLELHPDLVQLIRRKVALVDRDLLKDQHARETFLEILNQRGNVAPIVRWMHETGVLGRYLPEFGLLTNLVQHEFFHQYAADEHTLICLDVLDRVWDGKEEPYSQYSETLQSLEKPYLLYLALLLHDAGKAGESGSHEIEGANLARRVAQRFELSNPLTNSLCLVIQNHLAMAQISQRRDLDDPKVIRDFAALVQTEENAKLLTLHTFADSLGTSRQLWNDFKDTLLQTLFRRAANLLRGDTGVQRSEEKQRELLKLEVARIMPKPVTNEELQAHFTELPPRYYIIHSAREILEDLEMAHKFMLRQVLAVAPDSALTPVVVWRNEPDRACSVAKVCTWDRPGLFSRLAGAFSACGLNILSAQIFTRGDRVALDTFHVVDGHSGAVVGRESRERCEQLMRKILSGKEVDLQALIRKQKHGSPLYQSLEGDRLTTRIFFDNDTSENRTVIEIETEDQLGLLYAICETLAKLKLDIDVAKIVTEKGAAIDSFYISSKIVGKIVSADQQKFIHACLEEAIEGLRQ
ncbi:MAG: [protein-PII] uridylyltransferase [Verrucomicrobiota bacterium]